MSEFYRIVGLPDRWPAGEQQPMSKRPKAPFKAGWTDTIKLLEAEVRALKGRDVLLGLDVRVEDLNRQGGIRADARIRNSAVVLELTSGPDRLTFPCDAFDWWQSNVRALALALGDLRRVDRYRVNRGMQYQGFKALGSGAPAGQPAAMTPEEAAAVISIATEREFSEWEILNSSERCVLATRAAKAVAHPDSDSAGDGMADLFVEVKRAEEVLIAHHAKHPATR